MKRVSGILWGIVLIAIGSLLALNTFGVLDFNLFFEGWWTLIIIIPCAISFVTESDKVGSLIGVTIGVLLLLCCQDVLSFDMLWKLIIPAIIVFVGIKMIFNSLFKNKSSLIRKELKNSGVEAKSGFAAFSGNNLVYDGEVFNGAELNAIFGGVKCDLTNAIFERDTYIDATAVFGGIDIIVPNTVNVKCNATSIFGGLSDKKHKNSSDNQYTIYVNGTCIFGGVDIK